MLIKWVEAEDFRGFAGVNFFELGEQTEIIGENGVGKSSIGETITFTLTGSDIEGKANSSDRLMRKGCNEMRTAVGLELNGRTYEIERRVYKFKSKTETQILINGQPGNQEQIETLIGDRKVFLAAFLPDFFCSLVGTDARQEIVKLLPLPTDESVFERMKEDDPILVDSLTGVNLVVPEDYISKQKKSLNELKEERLVLEGQDLENKKTLQIEIPDEVPIDASSIDEKKKQIRDIESEKPTLVDTSEMERNRTRVLADYQALQKGLVFDEKFIDHPCEKCGHVNHINLNEEQDIKNAEISAKMAELLKESDQIAAEINKSYKLNDAAKETFETANAQKLSQLRGELQLMESNVRALQEHNLKVKVLQNNRNRAIERVREITEETERTNKLIEETEQRIKAAQAFNVKRCEMQVTEIEQYLDRVSIKLFDIVKSTGEIKPVFKLEYDKKEYRVLSTSEKVRCGLEVAKLIRTLTKRNIPVFIDCAESVTHFEKPDSQLLLARVVKGKELSINKEMIGA